MARDKKTDTPTDRRAARRYSIEQALYYKRCGKGLICEHGKTVDISSGGVRFTSDSCSLQPGDTVEVSMNWPALLGGGCPLKLQILGYVVRSAPDSAVVKIVRYEFRTRREGSEFPEDIPSHPQARNTEVSFGRRSWLSRSSA